MIDEPDMFFDIVDRGRRWKVRSLSIQDLVTWDEPGWKTTGYD